MDKRSGYEMLIKDHQAGKNRGEAELGRRRCRRAVRTQQSLIQSPERLCSKYCPSESFHFGHDDGAFVDLPTSIPRGPGHLEKGPRWSQPSLRPRQAPGAAGWKSLISMPTSHPNRLDIEEPLGGVIVTTTACFLHRSDPSLHRHLGVLPCCFWGHSGRGDS